MEFEYKGANAVIMTTKQATIAVDPRLTLVGLRDITTKFNIELATQEQFIVPKEGALVVSSPGEYETLGTSIKGISAQRHIDTPEDGKNAVIYRVAAGDLAVGVIGHIAGALTDEQLEALGILDVLIVPVGGNGYTLDAHGAVQVVRQVDPKVVIPTHYADTAIKYEMPQRDLEEFVKELGAPHEATPKLKLKASNLPAGTSVFELTRTT